MHCICTQQGTRQPDPGCDLCGGRPDHFTMAGPVPDKELGLFIEMADPAAASSDEKNPETGQGSV